MLPSPCQDKVGTRKRGFRSSIPGLCFSRYGRSARRCYRSRTSAGGRSRWLVVLRKKLSFSIQKPVLSRHTLTHLISPHAVLMPIFLVIGLSTLDADENWRMLRGPDGSGVASSDGVVMEIDQPNNLVWRTELPESGWSSPITDGNKLWLTSALTHDVTSKPEGEPVGKGMGGGRRIISGSVTLIAYCLAAKTGEIVHRIELATIKSPDKINVMNSYASPTGVWVGDRVVLHFGLYGTYCLHAETGAELWRQTLTYDDSIGPGSSVKQANGVVIVPCDGMGDQFVAGLSLETGEIIWQTTRPPVEARAKEFRSSYSSPLIIQVNGQSQAIVPGTQWCVAYNVRTGDEVWRLQHGKGFSLGCTPIAVDGKVIIATGYGGNELVAIDPTGSGDVTNTHILWRQSKGMPLMSSPIRLADLLYTVTDSGILHALRHSDGELVWRHRLGGKFSSSPFASGDRLLVGDHDGSITTFRATDKFEEIARYELGEQVMASPIPIGDDLILRTKVAIYRFSQDKTK